MFAPPPFKPVAVVFDLDGILVDSEDLWGVAEQRVVEDLGHAWDPAVRAQMLGRGPDDAAAVLATALGGLDAADVAQRLLEAVTEEFERGVPVNDAALELVAGLKGRVPLGVATNSRRVVAELSLASAGLLSAFDAVVTADDVTAPKPAPDPYATACAWLGVDPVRTVGVEDSPVGAHSAKAAGLWVVGCPSFPDERMDAADVVVDSLALIDPDLLLAGG